MSSVNHTVVSRLTGFLGSIVGEEVSSYIAKSVIVSVMSKLGYERARGLEGQIGGELFGLLVNRRTIVDVAINSLLEFGIQLTRQQAATVGAILGSEIGSMVGHGLQKGVSKTGEYFKGCYYYYQKTSNAQLPVDLEVDDANLDIFEQNADDDIDSETNEEQSQIADAADFDLDEGNSQSDINNSQPINSGLRP